jgi:hypothetical protein
MKVRIGNEKLRRKFKIIWSESNIKYLLETFCPPRSLNMKSGPRRREEKLY